MSSVYFLTNNNEKLKEYQRLLDRYNIKAINDISQMKKKLIGVVREYSCLFSVNCENTEKKENVELNFEEWLKNKISQKVTMNSTLEIYNFTIENGKIDILEVVDKFNFSTEGMLIDSLERVPVDNFGWDFYFYPSFSSLSYYTLKNLGLKNSPRDICISKFCIDKLYYEKCQTWKHLPDEKFCRPIDFSEDVCDVFTKVIPQTENINFLFKNAITSVCNSGVFFKRSINKRQSIFWAPGGNSGLPFTAKSSSSHELVYFFHDILHQLIPDSVYTGESEINLYSIVRTMSETITLVLADMLFVGSMLQDGHEYETVDKRKIYPLFRSMFGEKPDMKKIPIKKLVLGSAKYGMLGCTKIFEDFIKQNNGDVEQLKNFRDKYDSYLVQDFNWSYKNGTYMCNHKEMYKKWYSDYENVFVDDLELFTLSDYCDSCKNVKTGDELIEKIFEIFWNNYLYQCFEEEKEDIKLEKFKNRQNKAFQKWAVNQMLFCYKYEICFPKIQLFMPVLKKYIVDCNIEKFRSTYETMLRLCVENGVITEDDYITFKDVFPIFESSFIGYDYKEDDLKGKVMHFVEEALKEIN
jgi:hypothetical protein